jgi:hypothetical protein
MHIALIGALVGLGIAVLIFVIDYVMLQGHAAERAKKRNRKSELDNTEKKRIRSLAGFCLFLPPAFALVFWMLWG